MAAGLYGFRVKVDASDVKSGLKRKFILHIDYIRHKTIADVVSSVQQILTSKKSIVLFVDDYYLPASESIHTIREGDEITVFHEAAFSDDTYNYAEPVESNIEYSEWKEKKKHKKEANSKHEKKQKRKKYKTETSDCIADFSDINGENNSETFNPDTTGNLESEGSMLVNCSSLLVSSDECQVEESLRTSVKAPKIDTVYEHKQIKTSKEEEEEENVNKRKREESTEAAQNRHKYKTNKHLKKDAVGHLLEVLKATESEVAHAFTHSKTNENTVKQDTLYSPIASKEGSATQKNKTEECDDLVGEAVDTSQLKDTVNSPVSQTDACSENKRKRKRKRTNKKSKFQKLDSKNKTPVNYAGSEKKVNYAGSEKKSEESHSVSRKHIRFAEDVEENVEEDDSLRVSANTTATENLENSVNTTITEIIATAETSEEPVAVSTTLNLSLTSSKQNGADKLQSTSLEQNTARKSTQWDIKPDVPDASAFSKLLSLGWGSTPLVYERKKPIKAESPSAISKDYETKQVENSAQQATLVNGHTEMNGMNFQRDISLTAEKIVNYPILESSPRKRDILAFKILRLGKDYTPQLSDYIVAEVKHFCPDSQQMELNILQGADQCLSPKGKFDIENEEAEENSSEKLEVLHLNWNELIGARILYP